MSYQRRFICGFLAVLTGFFTSSLIAQQWRANNYTPLFRGTALGGLAATNKSKSNLCNSNLRQIGTAARMFANDSGGALPSTWQQFTNYIGSAALLYCPADSIHSQQTNWGAVNFSAISYQIISPGALDSDPTKVFVRCNTHTNIVYVSGATKEARLYEPMIPAADTGELFPFNPAMLTAHESALVVNCVSTMKQLAVASYMYANDNAGFLPSVWTQVTNYLESPAAFYCPAETTNVPPSDFASINFSNVSYTIVAPGIDMTDPTITYARCRTHGTYLLADGSVQKSSNAFPQLIIGHPYSQTVEPGSNATFQVVVISDPTAAPFRYQWRKKQPIDGAGFPYTNTVVIAGATNSIFQITNVQTANEGYYDVFVQDAKGRYQQSYMAYLRVEPLSVLRSTFSWDSISCLNNLKNIGLACRMYANNLNGRFPTNLSSISNYLGWPLTLYCPNDSLRSPVSQWSSVNFTNTSYVLMTNADDTIPAGVLAQCKIHSFYVQSDGAVIYPFEPPSIITQPNNTNVLSGTSVTLAVVASGTNLTFQWRKNGNVLTGSTLTTLQINSLTTNNSGQYTVTVSNIVGAVTSLPATLTVVSGIPLITTQPQSQTVNVGGTATFTVVTSGSGLGYQWRKNGTAIAGATDAAYTKTNVQPSDAANYTVLVTNVAGSVVSSNAVLTVNTPPNITQQPQNQTTVAGSNATFSVTATGSAPLGYQWRFATTNIASATNTTYTVIAAQSSNAGPYTVVVTNGGGAVTSVVASLTVNVRPTITLQPQNLTVDQGNPASFSVGASGTAPLSYQWRFNGINVSGATATLLTRTNSQRTNAGSYDAVVTSAVGAITSSVAVLSVNEIAARLQSVIRSNSTTRLNLLFSPGRTNILQATTNLAVSWTNVAIYPITNGTTTFLETNVAPRRFFRLSVP